MVVIGLTGMPASGKSLVANFLAEEGIPVFRMSDVIRETLESKSLEHTLENFETAAVDLRKRFGVEIIAMRILPRVVSAIHNEQRACIDGLRSLAELEVFRRAFRDFRLVAIWASSTTRYFRTLNNPRSGIATFGQFTSRDRKNLELGVGDVIAVADQLIVNDGLKPSELRKLALSLFNSEGRG